MSEDTGNGNGDDAAEASDEGTQPSGAAGSARAEEHPHAEAPSRWRRLWRWLRRDALRGTGRPLLAGGLAGVLLATSAALWQTNALGVRDEAVCWGALGADEAGELLGWEAEVRASEMPVSEPAGRHRDGLTGSCRLEGDDASSAVRVRLHTLDTRLGADREWADAFLAARLQALGGGVLGMASDERAWVALPDTCVDPGSGYYRSLTVVDVTARSAISHRPVSTERRQALGRIAVASANAVLRQQDCAGKLPMPEPSDSRPRKPSEEDGKVCGMSGLRASGLESGPLEPTRVTAGQGPVRTCDHGFSGSAPEFRLMTVTDPRLARIYTETVSVDGPRLTSERGKGYLGEKRAVFRVGCQTGYVVFVMQRSGADEPDLMRELFPRYVAAEMERLACGTVDLELPG